MFNCLLTGVGGQGTVLLSRLIGSAAIARGLNVRGAETIGMAQRGGGVVSHIRISGKIIYSPLIPLKKADLIIAFEPAEALRVHGFLAPAGRMLVCSRSVPPVSSALGTRPYDPQKIIEYLTWRFARPDEDAVRAGARGEICFVDGEKLIAACGSAKVLNTALLGAAVAKNFLPFKAAEMLAVIREKVPAKYRELNEKAFALGMETGGK